MDSKEGSCDCALVLCNTHFSHSIYLYINFILSNYHNSVFFYVVFVIVYWFYAMCISHILFIPSKVILLTCHNCFLLFMFFGNYLAINIMQKNKKTFHDYKDNI